MRSIYATLIAILLAGGAVLASCSVKVVEEEPKGGCLYVCEHDACCKRDVTQAECSQHGGSWSKDLKECPKDRD
jgi:hypothetical protein